MSARLAMTQPIPSTLPASAWQTLREECTKGQTMAWLTLPTPAPQGWRSRRRPARAATARLVWLGWQGQSALLVVGAGEQQVPGLLQAAEQNLEITLTVRGSDTKARLLSWPTRAVILDPTTDAQEWTQAARTLTSLRLNGPVAGLALPAVWKEHATLLRLDPVDSNGQTSGEHPAFASTPSTLPTDSLAAPPMAAPPR